MGFMTHKRCGGRVCKEMHYTSEGILELSCISCGKDWYLPEHNALARWILRK